MGIRPQFLIVIGIDDGKPDDERRTKMDSDTIDEIVYERELTDDEMWKSDDGFFDDKSYADKKLKGYSRRLEEIIYNPHLDSEWHLGNIIGLITHKGKYDDTVIRALATLDEKWLQSGYERIATLDPEEHHFSYKRLGYDDTDIACNRFVPSVFENMPTISKKNWQRAVHYLKMIGWNIPEEDLRYLLIWNWS